MLEKPDFKECYSVETIEPDKVFFLSEKEAIWLKDRIYCSLAALIDGDRNIETIIDRIQLELLEDEMSVSDPNGFFQKVLNFSIKAQYALLQMEQRGYIVEANPSLPSNLAIFCQNLNISVEAAQQRLATNKVAVKALGSTSAEDFISILESLKIRVVTEEADFTVVLTDDYLDPELEEFDRLALKSESPWLLVKPLGSIVWIGPIFRSHTTGCWQCLAKRLRDNRPIEGFIQRNKDISTPLTPPLGFLASTVQTALGMAATEVFKWIVKGENKRLENNLITYDPIAVQTRDHAFVKRPQCSHCGQMVNSLTKTALPVVLGHRKKTFTADGGHRSCSPEETLRKYQHHISPITGVVRELTKIPGNGLTHNYIAKHHFASIFDDLASLQQNLGGRSAGKGKTDSQAMASGFCEAIERYSGVYQGYEIREKGSYQQMGDKAIHPNACMNFSQQQYENRERWNIECQGWFQ